jgi:hypothetical protein
VGAQDVERVALSVTVAHIVSFFIVADTDIRIRVNSELTPDQEFNLAAGQPLGWNNQAALQPVPSNPLLFDITSLYFFNKGTVAGVIPTGGLKTANINGSFLLTQETQTS